MREQRALNDLMVGVRDAIARLTGDVAALAARVSETREFAERLADRPAPPQAQAGPVELPPEIAARLDGLETAIGQLAASVSSGPSAAPEAPDLTPLVHITVPEAIRGAVPAALRDVIPEAIRDAVPRALRDAIPEAVRGAVEGELSRVADSAGEARAEVSEAVTDAVAGLRGALVSALEATRDEMRRSSEELRELIGASGTEARDSLGRSVEDLRTTLTAASSSGLKPADVKELIDHAAAGLGERLDEVRSRGDALAETLTEMEGHLGDRLGAIDAISGDVRVAVRESVDVLSADVSSIRDALQGTADLSSAIESAITEGREGMQESIDAIAAQIREDASSAAERVRSEAGLVLEKTTSLAQSATERLGEASTLALARIGTTGETVIDRLQDAAATIEREVAKVPRAARDIATRMDEFQETMLAYLTARDLALEETRDRVIQELLDEYATGLSHRQRSGLGTGLRRAFARRKDRRDAARYRSGSAAEEVPELPQVDQQTVERAATELARRARAAEPASDPTFAAPTELPAETPIAIAPATPAPPPVRAAPARPPASPRKSAEKLAPKAKPKRKPTAPARLPVRAKAPADRVSPKPAEEIALPAEEIAKPAAVDVASQSGSRPEVASTPATAAKEFMSQEPAHLPGGGEMKAPDEATGVPIAGSEIEAKLEARSDVSPREFSRPEPKRSRPKAVGLQASEKPAVSGPAEPKSPRAKQELSKVAPAKAAKAAKSSAVRAEPPAKGSKPKAPAKKPARAGAKEGSLAERLAADAKRTADRLAAESRARTEAVERARAEEAGTSKGEDT